MQLDEMAFAAAERFEAEGKFAERDLILGLVELDRAMLEVNLTSLGRQLAERVARIRASGVRLALPELDARRTR